MGSAQSKIENEEAVNIFKDRKRLTKDAVTALNDLAAALSGYATALKDTGAALSDYARGVVNHPHPPPLSASAASSALSTVTPPASYETLPPPPPPLPNFNPAPLQRAPSMPKISVHELEPKLSDPIIEEEEEVDERRFEREEKERKMNEEQPAKRADLVFDSGDGSGGGRRRNGNVEAAEVAEKTDEVELPPPQTEAVKKVSPMESRRGGDGTAPPSVSLLQTFDDLNACFLKASESTHEVLKMLEAYRLHYHSNFADNRGHIENRSFRGLQNAEDGMDETHAPVLDEMLAWEEKLYDEVKTGEQMKFEYQRKVALLNKLKKRNASAETIEKTEAALSHLHTRCFIVEMQFLDSTGSKINRLRDDQLYPRLLTLFHRMATMWENMTKQHEYQLKIARTLESVDISQFPEEISGRHHECTRQLWLVARKWHSQFEKLMNHQKEYTGALNSWLKLNLEPKDNNLKEKVSSPERPKTPPTQSLLIDWHDRLEKLPDDIPKTAISNFADAIWSIVQYQLKEMKLRDKYEETQKDLDRKTRQYEDWLKKYMQRRTRRRRCVDWYKKYMQRTTLSLEEIDLDGAHDKEVVIKEREMIALDTLRKRLEEEKTDYRKCIQARKRYLEILKTRLPELFKAMRDFSNLCSDMYRNLADH